MFSFPLRNYVVGGLAIASSLAVANISNRNISGEIPTAKHQSISSSESEIVRKQDSEECDCVPMWECMQAKCNGDVCKSCEKEEKILRACLARVSEVHFFTMLLVASDFELSPEQKARDLGLNCNICKFAIFVKAQCIILKIQES